MSFLKNFSIFDFMHKQVSSAEMDRLLMQKAEEVAFRELALYIAISYIANTISKCEIKTYESGKEVHGDLYYRLNVSPNPNQNSSQFWNQVVERYYFAGDALVLNLPPCLYCATSYSIDPHPLKEDIFKSISVGIDRVRKDVKASEVFYFKLDDRNAKSLLNCLYSSYGEIMGYALKSFKRSNGQKYKLVLDNYKAGDTEFVKQFNEVIKKQLDSFLNSDQAVYPQFKGTSLEDIGASQTGSTSSDIISIRKEIFDVTAQAMKLPLPLMYGNTDNLDEIVKIYLTFCIDPLADMIEEEMTRKHYRIDGWKDGCYVQVDTSCIKHIDIIEVADAVSKAIGSGTVNIDDMRRRLGLPILGTDFSRQFWMTKNYEKIENMLVGTAE